MGRKIWYAVLILVTVYLEIMYDSDWMLTFLAFELLLAAGMLLLALYFRWSVRVWLDLKIPVAAKGEKIPLEIHIENRGILPVAGVRIVLGFGNVCGKTKEKRILEEYAARRSEKKVTVLASSDYCGGIRFFLYRVKVWDYLKLFGQNLKCRSEIRINVLPQIVEMPVEVTARTRNFPVDGDEYEKDRGGDDPAEIFQIREFRDGDRLQRIHWKMSARMDELMTKEYSMPRGCKVLLLLDYRQEQQSPASVDRFLTFTAALGFSMLSAGCLHDIAWYDQSTESIVHRSIQKEEDMYEILDLLMTSSGCSQPYDVEAAYRSRYPERHFSTVLLLDMECTLKGNGRQVFAAEGGELEQALTGFVLEV